MTAQRIEEAAMALHAIEDSWNDHAWEYLPESVQELFRSQATAALKPSLDHIFKLEGELADQKRKAALREMTMNDDAMEVEQGLKEQLAAVEGERDRLRRLFDKVLVQADCLEKYAEGHGFSGDGLPSVFHLQASHFRDYANEALNGSPPSDNKGKNDG